MLVALMNESSPERTLAGTLSMMIETTLILLMDLAVYPL